MSRRRSRRARITFPRACRKSSGTAPAIVAWKERSAKSWQNCAAKTNRRASKANDRHTAAEDPHRRACPPSRDARLPTRRRCIQGARGCEKEHPYGDRAAAIPAQRARQADRPGQGEEGRISGGRADEAGGRARRKAEADGGGERRRAGETARVRLADP